MSKQDKKPDQSLIVSSFNDVARFSNMVAASQLAPHALRGKPHDVGVIIMSGIELGLPPMTALRTIHIVEGKVTLSADLVVALAQKHPDCEYFMLKTCTSEGVTYACKRRGAEPVSYEYTIDDAKQAGLLGRSTWKKHPKAMMRARCKSILAREVFPDALAGVYSLDEAQDIDANFSTPEAEPEPEPEALDAEIVEDASPKKCTCSRTYRDGTHEATCQMGPDWAKMNL